MTEELKQKEETKQVEEAKEKSIKETINKLEEAIDQYLDERG